MDSIIIGLLVFFVAIVGIVMIAHFNSGSQTTRTYTISENNLFNQQDRSQQRVISARELPGQASTYVAHQPQQPRVVRTTADMVHGPSSLRIINPQPIITVTPPPPSITKQAAFMSQYPIPTTFNLNAKTEPPPSYDAAISGHK